MGCTSGILCIKNDFISSICGIIFIEEEGMNKKKLLIAFLLAFSMTTGISYAEEENIISPKVEVNDTQLNPENSSKQENSTEKADQTE